jgi:hypothetical protein
MEPDSQAFQRLEQELNELSMLVNFSIYLRQLIVEEGFSEVVLMNPNIDETRRLIIFTSQL